MNQAGLRLKEIHLPQPWDSVEFSYPDIIQYYMAPGWQSVLHMSTWAREHQVLVSHTCPGDITALRQGLS